MFLITKEAPTLLNYLKVSKVFNFSKSYNSIEFDFKGNSYRVLRTRTGDWSVETAVDKILNTKTNETAEKSRRQWIEYFK